MNNSLHSGETFCIFLNSAPLRPGSQFFMKFKVVYLCNMSHEHHSFTMIMYNLYLIKLINH